MTFKSTSQNLNHIQRVASASTRPRANGRIDMIPEDAREPEEYYNSIRVQYEVLNREFYDIQIELSELNKKLKLTLPFSMFATLSAKRERLTTRYNEIKGEVGELRIIVRATGKEAWAFAFYAVARRVLDRELFIKLDQEVQELLGRNMTEVTAGETEWSSEKKAASQIADRRQAKRKRYRDSAPTRAYKASLAGEGA